MDLAQSVSVLAFSGRRDLGLADHLKQDGQPRVLHELCRCQDHFQQLRIIHRTPALCCTGSALEHHDPGMERGQRLSERAFEQPAAGDRIRIL